MAFAGVQRHFNSVNSQQGVGVSCLVNTLGFSDNRLLQSKMNRSQYSSCGAQQHTEKPEHIQAGEGVGGFYASSMTGLAALYPAADPVALGPLYPLVACWTCRLLPASTLAES